ncbi:MAG: phosphodiester glycosidase family protein [Candidatus Margulisiibacteriota bacterium]
MLNIPSISNLLFQHTSSFIGSSKEPSITPTRNTPMIYTEGTYFGLDYSIVSLNPDKINFTFLQESEAQDNETNPANNSIVFNGGYFNDQRNPDGLLIYDNLPYSQISDKKVMSGVFSIYNGRARIDRSVSFTPNRNVNFAIQNGPLVIEHGERGILSDTENEFERTILATDYSGNAFLVIIKTPVDLYDCQDLLIDKIPNLDSALDLDGGPSTYYRYHSSTSTASFGTLGYPAYFIKASIK